MTDVWDSNFAYPQYRRALSAAGFAPPYPSPSGLTHPLPDRDFQNIAVAIERMLLLFPRDVALNAIDLLKLLDTHTATDLEIFYSFLSLSAAGVTLPPLTYAAFIQCARSSGRVGWAVYLFLHWPSLTDALPTSALNSILGALADTVETPALLASPRFFPEGFCGLTLAETTSRALQHVLFKDTAPAYAKLIAEVEKVVESRAIEVCSNHVRGLTSTFSHHCNYVIFNTIAFLDFQYFLLNAHLF